MLWKYDKIQSNTEQIIRKEEHYSNEIQVIVYQLTLLDIGTPTTAHAWHFHRAIHGRLL